MSDIDSGGPAFPHCDGPTGTCFIGLTKREWFAGMALQGLLAHSCDTNPNLINEPADSVAKSAFKMADAMLRSGKG